MVDPIVPMQTNFSDSTSTMVEEGTGVAATLSMFALVNLVLVVVGRLGRASMTKKIDNEHPTR